MVRRQLVLGMVMVGAMTATASAANEQIWILGGTFACAGHELGNGVRVSCSQDQTRGNRIYTIVSTFTMRGPVARSYLGKHEGCWHIEAKDTRMNKDIITCPGIPEWWH